MPDLQLRLNANQHRKLREAATTIGTTLEMFAVDAATYEADRILVANPWSTTAADPAGSTPPSQVFSVTAVER